LHDLIGKKPLLSIETIWYARHCQTLDAGRPQAPKDGLGNMHNRTARNNLSDREKVRSSLSLHAGENLATLPKECDWMPHMQ
jgi:hypothetical protein